MISQSTPRNNVLRIWIIVGVGLVLLWRVAAYVWPSSMIEIADDLRVPTLLLGLLFLVCGAYTYWSRPSPWTLVFLVHCLGSGMHWGGSIGGLPMPAELGLLFVYLAFTVMADAALLHLALIYPRGKTIPLPWRIGFYAPALSASLFVPVAGFVPEAVLQTTVGVLLMLANALSLIGAGVFVVRAFLVDAVVRRTSRLGLIVGGILVGGAVPLLGEVGVLPGLSDAWNLAYGIIPVTIAIAFATADRANANAA